MIIIPQSLIAVWPDFSLEIKNDLTFETGCRYHLSGPNGSGKTSLITQILIPKIQQSKSYILYFEQQMHLQLYAIKAYAALMHKDRVISSEADMMAYLFENLQMAYSAQPRDIYLIADESHELQNLMQLCDFAPHALIFTSHHNLLSEARSVHFHPKSLQCSEVYVPD
ncbi:MAG TPA: hypothetical protein PKI59_01145 [Candidatus Cloacimonadota bacterium]|jgi:ATPase subunit of ABC transporter with duplicated ATPase domains|nr:hypothetical protein [Candidatus Cloacimonadota bacterium]